MTKSFWLAFAAYLLPTFPLGYFWHLKLFKHAYDSLELYRPEVIIPFGLASMVIQGLIFAWVYPRLFNTSPESWLQSACLFFIVFGLLAFSFVVLPVAAKYNMTSVTQFMALEASFTALQFAIVSPLIALAYRGGA